MNPFRDRSPLGPLLVLLIAIIVGAGLLAGNSSKLAPKHPAVTAPAPALAGVAPPAGQVPSCTPAQQHAISEGHGKLGVCAPAPQPGIRLGFPAGGASGPDTSNNDPLYNWQPVKARGHQFGYAKVNQGAWFTDQTAVAQIKAIRSAKLVAGGYDFYEVCVGSGRAEATFYLRLLRRTGAEGTGALPAAGDAEWPLSPSCSIGGARRWIAEWVNTVYAATHRNVVLYTGAWWWNPHVGCWWPAHAVSWISGYGVSYPFMPCSLHALDFWQFSSSYPITGSFTGDMSVWRGSRASFNALTRTGPTPAEVAARRRAEHAHLKRLDRELPKIRRHLLNAGCKVKRPRRACRPLLRRGAAVKREAAILRARLYPHH